MTSKCILVAIFALLTLCSSAYGQGELKTEITAPGDCSRTAKSGDTLSMHYSGTLDDGSEFDSSYKRNQPFDLQLGAGHVIRGWDEGIVGMCVGEKRMLTIPPHMGYGESGYPPVIPASATLHFLVELLEITNSSDEL